MSSIFVSKLFRLLQLILKECFASKPLYIQIYHRQKPTRSKSAIWQPEESTDSSTNAQSLANKSMSVAFIRLSTTDVSSKTASWLVFLRTSMISTECFWILTFSWLIGWKEFLNQRRVFLAWGQKPLGSTRWLITVSTTRLRLSTARLCT